MAKGLWELDPAPLLIGVCKGRLVTNCQVYASMYFPLFAQIDFECCKSEHALETGFGAGGQQTCGLISIPKVIVSGTEIVSGTGIFSPCFCVQFDLRV